MTRTPDRVVILDPGNYTPYYDANLCAVLANDGWRVEWVTSPHLFEPVQAPSSVRMAKLFFNAATSVGRRFPGPSKVRRGLKAATYPAGLWRVDRFLASGSRGILHVQWALLPAVDGVMWRRWRSRGWRIVYTAHDVIGLEGTTPRAVVQRQPRLFRLADAVIAHSEHDRARIIEFGAMASRVFRMPQGTPGLFANALLNRRQARAELGLAGNRPTILFFGYLKPYKGLEVLLESLASIRALVPDVLLLIAGESLMNKKHIERLMADPGIRACVRWDARYIPAARVGLYFAAADVVVLPYLAASSSAVLLNAAAHARPVVATTVGGLPEMVCDGVTGLLVPPSDRTALAAAVSQLIRNPMRAQEMGEHAKKYALARHDWSCIGRLTTEVYERSCRSSPYDLQKG